MAKQNGRSGRKGRRLAVVSLEYLPPHISGNGVYAEQVVRALDENWDIKVVAGYQGGPLPCRVVPVPLAKKGPADSRFEFALKALSALEMLEGWAPDLVLAVDWYSAPLSILLREKTGCPILWMPFRVFSYQGGSMLSMELERLISRNAEAVLAVSEADASLVEKFFGRKAACVYPPLTLKGGVKSRRGKCILTVSRVSREKNLEALIEVMPLIPEGYSLVVAGGISDKTYLEELRTLARRLEVRDRVTFLGRVSRSTLERLYSSAAVYVSPAKYEPFGLSILEAAYHRLPVVMDSSRLVGAGELFIHGRSCIKVDVGRRAEFAGAVKDLLLSPEKASLLGEEGRKAAEKLTFEDFRDKINNFIFGVVDR